MPKVTPRDVYNMFGTNEYGFYERIFLGKSAFRKTYAAMNLSPIVNGKPKCGNCYGESLTKLLIKRLPESWDKLKVNEQLEFEKILKRDIQTAIEIAYSKTGL